MQSNNRFPISVNLCHYDDDLYLDVTSSHQFSNSFFAVVNSSPILTKLNYFIVMTINKHRNVIRKPTNNKFRMDDKRCQKHIKLATEYGKTQLNIGHLVDQNKEGRGDGFELRTDEWGTIAAEKGLYLTTQTTPKAQGKQLDMQGAISQIENALSIAKSLQHTTNQAKPTVLTPKVKTNARQELNNDSDKVRFIIEDGEYKGRIGYTKIKDGVDTHLGEISPDNRIPAIKLKNGKFVNNQYAKLRNIILEQQVATLTLGKISVQVTLNLNWSSEQRFIYLFMLVMYLMVVYQLLIMKNIQKYMII